MNIDALLRDAGALVCDLGWTKFLAGRSPIDIPAVQLKSAIGVRSGDVRVAPMSFRPRLLPDKRINQNSKYLMNLMVQTEPQENVEVVNCMKDGMIDDWDLFEQLFKFAFKYYLRTDPTNHPLLFTESPLNLRSKREKFSEVMFEKYNVPAIFLCKDAVLAALACQRSTGLVVDCGATHTSVVPIYNNYVISDAIVRSPYGGNFITEQCKQFLNKTILPCETGPRAFEERLWNESEYSLPVTDSWYNYMSDLIAQDFQHSTLRLLEKPFDEKIYHTPAQYQFPNRYVHECRSERFKIPETLFCPDPYKNGSMLGIIDIISMCIEVCEEDLRPAMYNNIIVTGGNSLIEGFPERLHYGLTKCTPANMKLNLIYSEIPIERHFGSWIGGSVLASSETFGQRWFSRKEYIEGGSTQIHLKCP